MRSLLAGSVLALALAAGALAAARGDLAADYAIARVDVSGLDQAGAKAKLQAALAPAWERPVTVRVGTTDQQVASADLGQTVDYDGMVADAFKAAAHHQTVKVRLARSIAGAQLSEEVAKLAKPFYKAPRDAKVRLGVAKIKKIRGRFGHGIDTHHLRQALINELRKPTAARVVAETVERIAPKVTVKKLAKLYSTYISVDRSSFKLRLFKRLRLFEDVPDRRRHGRARDASGPAPRARQAGRPHLARARTALGRLARRAERSRPGAERSAQGAAGSGPRRRHRHPRHRRRTRAIGTRASHGCIRMHVSDVIDLYNRACRWARPC